MLQILRDIVSASEGAVNQQTRAFQNYLEANCANNHARFAAPR